LDKLYKIEDFKFTHPVNTRWKDLDAFRHINNAVFLSYIEDARIVLLRRWNINYAEKSLIVASIKIDYLKQVIHPSSLIIGQRVSRIGNKSFDIQSAVFNEKDIEPVCISTITSVAFDFTKNQTVKVFEEIIDDYQK
tara:strand:- start:385 stop:795 length:411 start_codon:yes stop_codon:yes gene_type:complete